MAKQDPTALEDNTMAKRASKEDIQNLFRTPAKAVGTKTGRAAKMAPHIIVDAKAGTGKTTTMIGGLKYLKGEYPGFKPSPQQQVIWDCLKKGAMPESIAMVSFNKSIAETLQKRVPAGVNASTMHSMGFNAVKRKFKNSGRSFFNNWKTQNLLEDVTGKDIAELRKENYDAVQAVDKLAGLCKSLLLGWEPGHGFSADLVSDEVLEALAATYDVDYLDGEVMEYVRRILDASCRLEEMDVPCVDFNDMIWLPVVLDLPMFRYDLLMVDESQDLNPCQQELAMKAGNRMMFVGDPRQAIYAFTGADANSIRNILVRLGNTERGVESFPLNVTFRCGKKIVEKAQELVPEFFAHETNPEGEVTNIPRDKFADEANDGDMVICRTNAPLVGAAFRFIANGKKATIVGGDIGKSLLQLIKKLKAEDVGDLMEKVDTWYHEEIKKVSKAKYPNEHKLQSLQDKKDCILAFCEDCYGLHQVESAIQKMFVENVSSGIRLSSIHKAKGLEAERVYILHPELIPHPMAKTADSREQEKNLLYVAQTRPKLLLGFVIE
jgi:DNA helicase-2/ATP-dependent DNA helicase PcrA